MIRTWTLGEQSVNSVAPEHRVTAAIAPELRHERTDNCQGRHGLLCQAKRFVIKSAICSRVSGAIWFMPPARWRRLERSLSCVSCHSESAWRRSSRFRTAREPRMPPPGVNTEGLVEIITTPHGSRSRRLVVLSGLRGPARREYRNCADGWAKRRSKIAMRRQQERARSLWRRCSSRRTTSRRSACALARGPGFDATGAALTATRRDSGIQVLAEPPELRSGHHR